MTILPLDYPQLSISYNSFQASVNHRFESGFNILAAYTLANSLGTADGNVAGNLQNAHNIAAEKRSRSA